MNKEEKALVDNMRDNCRFCFIAGGKLIATFWDINEKRPWEYLSIGVHQALLAYQEETVKREKLRASYKALMEFIDNEEFAYVLYEFRIYVDGDLHPLGYPAIIEPLQEQVTVRCSRRCSRRKLRAAVRGCAY